MNQALHRGRVWIAALGLVAASLVGAIARQTARSELPRAASQPTEQAIAPHRGSRATANAQPAPPWPQLVSASQGQRQEESARNIACDTLSIVAFDAQALQCGVAVTSRVLQVGRLVPFVRAGVGAVATQALVETAYGPRGLELLAAGQSPEDTIRRLIEGDPLASRRQLGIVDWQGRTACFTGAEVSAAAASRQGPGYAVQGNLLTGPGVIEAMAAVLDQPTLPGEPLAERLLAALFAGQRAGGDRRTGRKQSAALVVADATQAGWRGDHLVVDLQVAEHEEPVTELVRLYRLTQQQLGFRQFHWIEGADVAELQRMLTALGYCSDDEAPPRQFQYDRATADAVDRFRADQNLPTPADDLGHPRGMVDEPLVRALRAAYRRQQLADERQETP